MNGSYQFWPIPYGQAVAYFHCPHCTETQTWYHYILLKMMLASDDKYICQSNLSVYIFIKSTQLTRKLWNILFLIIWLALCVFIQPTSLFIFLEKHSGSSDYWILLFIFKSLYSKRDKRLEVSWLWINFHLRTTAHWKLV